MVRKRIIVAVLMLFLLSTVVLTGCGGGSKGQNGEVRVYCFGDYIDPDLVYDFQEKTGIKVIMDTFDTNEEMYPVVSKRSVNYDVICCSDYMVEKLISEGLLYDFSSDETYGPLSKLENYANLDEKYLKIAEGCDPGNSYADIQGDIRLIAQSISEEEKGQQIIAKMDEIRDDIVKKVEKIPPEKRKSVTLLSVMRQYGGAGSAFDDMCRLTGVRNAIAEVGVKNGQVLTKELLVKSNPDYILLPSYDDKGTFDIDAFIASYLEDPSLASMRAIQNRALIFPRESYIYNSSQDFVFGMQELAYVVYGEEFAQEPNRHISFSGEK